MPSQEERIAALEKAAKWWRNPAWWAVLIAAAVAVNQIKPWEWVESAKPKPKPPPQLVKLIEPHAAAYAPYQWEADVRVINDTDRDIKVERVRAVFGKASYGRRCDKTGDATRILFPVTAPGQLRNVYVSLKRGEGALFKGGPNLSKAFGSTPCRLAVGRLKPVDHATFTALTDDGKQWNVTSKLVYAPRFRVAGASAGGGDPLCVLPFLLAIC
jgi:hypothetical protein